MHTPFMLKALEQARLGRGACAPNPSVGAVVVYANKIIAQAWHQGAGKEHAEVLVLKGLNQTLQDASLYVTLEPCNHWGKTPPCVNAIIESGIKTVVFGFQDPNPLVMDNNTPELLSKQGIEVIHWPLAEIDLFYKSYTYWMQRKKPWVTAKIAQSLDGKIAGPKGQRVNLSNESCKHFTHQQRLRTDIILTTASTILQDDPLLSVRIEKLEHKKPIAIIDRNLTLSSKAQVFSKALYCNIYHDEAVEVKEPINNCNYYPLPTANTKLDVEALIKHLGLLGFHDVWVEAGGRLFSELHKQQLVNTTYLYLVPKILGENAISAYHYKELFDNSYSLSWRDAEDNMIVCIEWGEQL